MFVRVEVLERVVGVACVLRGWWGCRGWKVLLGLEGVEVVSVVGVGGVEGVVGVGRW